MLQISFIIYISEGQVGIEALSNPKEDMECWKERRLAPQQILEIWNLSGQAGWTQVFEDLRSDIKMLREGYTLSEWLIIKKFKIS